MKFFTVIGLILPLSIVCMDIPDEEDTIIFWWQKQKDPIDTIDVTNKANLNNFFKEKNYLGYKREDLEKFIQKAINNKIDINLVEKNFEYAYLNSLEYGNTDDSLVLHKSTLLGYCTCREKYDLSGYVLAEILVSNGAKLSGSYEGKFGFYFIKKVFDSFLVSCDTKTPATKLFETLLYRRVQYCLQNSMYIYWIAKNIKKSYPTLSSGIPRFVIDHIAHFIIKDGVSDVMSVCNEEFTETYREFETGKRKTADWTLLKRWKKLLENKEYIPRWKPNLKSLDAQEWDKDFNEFMLRKRNPLWQPGNTNLIMRSLHYKQGSLYQDAEFSEMKN